MGFEAELQRCKNTSERLIPVFQDKYEIELSEIDFRKTTGGYQDASMKYSNGAVKVRADVDWNQYILDHCTAHELGHHAQHKNSNIDELLSGDNPDRFSAIGVSEACGVHFGEVGLMERRDHTLEEGD